MQQFPSQHSLSHLSHSSPINEIIHNEIDLCFIIIKSWEYSYLYLCACFCAGTYLSTDSLTSQIEYYDLDLIIPYQYMQLQWGNNFDMCVGIVVAS